MTQWYGPQGDTYHVTGQGGAWVPGPNGGMIWQPYAGSSADPNKTIWYGPNANYPGAAPVTYPPAPPAPTGPDMSWRGNDQYSVYGRLHGQGSYFPNPDTTQQLFYQTGEGRPVAYAKFMNAEADPNSYYYRWLQAQQARTDNGFKDASVADPNLQYTSYLDSHARDLYSQFANLPGWQQGYNAPGGFAGRRM